MKAKEVFTYEYRPIVSQHKRLKTGTPSQVARSYLGGKWRSYDVGFVYSSFEHDGLGRYGDPINPYGDLESMAKVSCLLKPGALLFFGMPTAEDRVAWNAHRVYGRARIPLLFAAWDVVDVIGTVDLDRKTKASEMGSQPVWVLKNTRP